MPKKEYNLKDDHIAIKKQIKKWEHTIDKVIIQLLRQTVKGEVDKAIIYESIGIMEYISNDMMAINM